jgi:hypothetical protein
LKTADAAYECNEWYEESLFFQHCIAIIITRSQIPVRLTCGKLYILSLENYANVSMNLQPELEREFTILGHRFDTQNIWPNY